MRDVRFNVERVPEPELTVDIDAIESGSQKTATKSSLVISNLLDLPQKPRPENVGITAIEIYSRKSVDVASEGNERNGVQEDLSSGATFGQLTEFSLFSCLTRMILRVAVFSLLSKYAIEPSRIGRVDVSSSGSSRAIISSIMNRFRSAGNEDVEGIISPSSSYASVTSFVNAVNWIESSSWDGRYAMVVVGHCETNVVVLIGADAPVILEREFSTQLSHGNILICQKFKRTKDSAWNPVTREPRRPQPRLAGHYRMHSQSTSASVTPGFTEADCPHHPTPTPRSHFLHSITWSTMALRRTYWKGPTLNLYVCSILPLLFSLPSLSP